MNRIMRNFVIVLALLVNVTAINANTNPTFTNEGKVLVVNLNDWTNSNLNVTIMDNKGVVLHYDQFLSGSSLGKKYNLKNLPVGNYALIIESVSKKVTHNLKVTNNEVIMNTFKQELIYRPMVNIDSDKIDMNLLTLGRNVSVSISDAQNEFFTKSFNNMTTVNKRFDITSLPKGNYTFIVKGKNQFESFAFVK